MIERLLPTTVACAAEFSDPSDAMLFPEEAATVASATEKRLREFTTGRMCARSALSRIGIMPAPILPGERGAAQWPPGVVGSITHCAGYRAAAVALARDVLTIGIDAEPDEVLPDGVLSAVSIPGERRQLRRLALRVPHICWDRLLFSAKESVYKAWFPLAQCELGFDDAEVTIHAMDGTFDARLLVSPPRTGSSCVAGFSGRWLACDGLVLTAVVVPVLGME